MDGMGVATPIFNIRDANELCELNVAPANSSFKQVNCDTDLI